MDIKKVYKKYLEISIEARAAIWFTICNFVLKAIDVVTVPIYTRLMSTEDYGMVSLFNSWQKVLIIFATLNFSSSGFNVGMVKFEKERDRFTSSLQGLSFCVVLGFSVIYLLFYEILKEVIVLPLELLLPMFFYFLVGPSFEFWCARQRFEYKYKKLIGMTLSVAVAIPVVSIVSICLSSDKANALIYSTLAVNCIVGVFFCVYNFSRGKEFYCIDVWRYALAYNVPLLPHFLSRIVLSQTDRIMISNYCGNTEIALYTVAYNAGLVIMLLYNSITVSYHPWNYQNLKEKNFSGIKEVSNMILIGFLFVTVLLILVAPEIMAILATEEYRSAMYVIPPVAASVFFQMLYTFFGNIEQYFMKTKFMSVASALAALINFVLNLYFIPRYGYIAASYTTLACYVLYALGHYIFMKRICKKELDGVVIYDEKSILLLSVFVILFSIGINFVYEKLIIRVILLCLLFVFIVIKRNKIKEMMSMLRKKK